MAGTARRARTGREGQLPRVLRSLAAAEEPLFGVARRVRTPGRGRSRPAPGSTPALGPGDPSCHPESPSRGRASSPLTGGTDLSFPRRDRLDYPPTGRRSGRANPRPRRSGPPAGYNSRHPRAGAVHLPSPTGTGPRAPLRLPCLPLPRGHGSRFHSSGRSYHRASERVISAVRAFPVGGTPDPGVCGREATSGERSIPGWLNSRCTADFVCGPRACRNGPCGTTVADRALWSPANRSQESP